MAANLAMTRQASLFGGIFTTQAPTYISPPGNYDGCWSRPAPLRWVPGDEDGMTLKMGGVLRIPRRTGTSETDKYQELAADLATQHPGWRVTMVPIVAECLGTCRETSRVLVSSLDGGLPYWSERSNLVQGSLLDGKELN